MDEFFFDIQKFADVTDGKVTLSANETFTVGGVDFKAGSGGAVLKADTTETEGDYTASAVTGITSGTVTATVSDATDSAAVTFDGSTAFDFTCTVDSGALKVGTDKSSIGYTSGKLTYAASGVTMPEGTIGIGGNVLYFLQYNVEFTIPSSGATLNFNGDTTKFSAADTVGAKLSFPPEIAEMIAGLEPATVVTLASLAGITITEEQAGMLLTIAVPIFENGLNLDLTGTIDYNSADKSILFADGTETNLYLGERTVSFTTDGDAGISVAFNDGKLTVTPGNNDGSLDIAVKNGDTVNFAANVAITGGSFVLDVLNQKMSVTAGTTTTITASEDMVGQRSFSLTAAEETGFKFALDETGNKLTLTPDDDNPLHIAVTNGSASVFERDIKLTGDVVIDMEENTFNVTKDTAVTFIGEGSDSTVTTTVTAKGDAGISLALDDGKLTITPGENDGALNITRKRDNTVTVLDLDLNITGSATIDPTSGEVSVAKDTVLEITNNQSGSYTSITVEGGDASFTLDAKNDGNVAISFDGGDGKLHVVHKHGDTTILDNTVELEGTISFDATTNTITVAKDTTLSVALAEPRTLTLATDGDANLTINAESGKISVKPGTDDGSLEFKITDGTTTIFDYKLAITSGGFAFDLPTQTLTVDAGTVTTFDVGQGRVFTFSLPNGATDKILIDDDGKINFTPQDSEPFHVKFANGDTTVLDADITFDGTATIDPQNSTISVAKDTATTIAFADGRTVTITADDTAGITASMDNDGKITLTPGEGDGKLNIAVNDGSTTREFDVELTGAIVFDPNVGDTPKIYAEAGTTLTITADAVGVSTSVTVTEDAGFTFTLDADSGKITITPDEGDGKLQITHKQGDQSVTAEVEVSGGSIVFDSTNNSLSVTEGTTTTISANEYSVELTVTGEAGITATLGDDGKISVSADAGDGELAFTLKKGDTVLNSGSVEFAGTIELDPANQTIGVTKDTSTTFTFGDYTYSITANDAASFTLSEKDGAITVTAPDGDGSLDIALAKGGTQIFAGNVEFTGEFTVDPVNQKISVTDDSQAKITMRDYVLSLEVTEDASLDVKLGDGTITLAATEGDGKAFIGLSNKDGSPLLAGIVELDGEITLDVANQAVSVAEGTSLTFDRPGSTTKITAVDGDAGFTIDRDGSKVTITPGTDDGKLEITRTQGDKSTTFDLEVNGAIVVDVVNNTLSLEKGTTIETTINDYTVTVTANDANGIGFSTDDSGNLVITPQEDGGSVDITVKNGDDVFENTVTLSDGSIKLNPKAQTLSVTGGTTLTLEQDGTTVNVAAKDDVVLSVFDNRPTIDTDDLPAFDPDNPPENPPDGSEPEPRTLYFKVENDNGASFDITATRDGEEFFSNTLTVGGTISYRASTNTFAMVSKGDSEFSDTETFIKIVTGEHSLTASTDGETAVNSISFADGKITLTFPDDEHNGLKVTSAQSGEEIFSGHVNIDGSISYDSTTNEFIVPADTKTTVTIGDYSAVLSVDDQAGFVISQDNNKVTITPGDGDGKLNATVYNGDDVVFGGTLEVSGGSIVFDNDNRTLGVTQGTTTTVTIGDNSVALTATDDASINVGLNDSGQLVITPQDGDGSIDVKYSVNGQVAFANNVEISGGSITVDALTNSIGLTKDTTITLSQFDGADGDKVSVKALDDANLTMTATESGLRIAPDSGDGDLQLSVTHDDFTRTATLGIDGAVVYQRGGNIALEEGTTVDLTWIDSSGDESYNLKLTSRGSSGTIALDADKGIGITSSDDKLDMELSISNSPNSMKFNGIQGTVWYNSGKVTLVEGSSFTSEGTFERSDVTLTMEAVDGDVSADLHTDHTIYSADTGTFKLIMADADGNKGTIAINEGSLTAYRSGDYVIQEGSDISTSGTTGNSIALLTGDAGNYVLNGHEFVTTVDGVKLTASGDTIAFAASEDVTCDDLNFTGNGNVSITADGEHLYGPGVYIVDEDLITEKTPTDEIIDKFTHGFDYGTPITGQSAVKELLAEGDRDQVLAMYFDDTVSADFSDDDGFKNVTIGGEYAQSVKFNNDGYNVAVVDEDARGKKNITTGNGGDLVVIEDTKAQVSVTTGTGADTIVSKGDDVNVSLTGGKDKIYPLDGNMTVAGYDATTDAGFVTKNISTDEIAEAVEQGYIDFADGRMSIDSAKVTFENTSEVVALYDRYGDKQLVGFTSQDDLLDASDYREPILFVGDGNSTMLGGSANDTVLASAGDLVDAGAGRNYIKMVDPAERNPLDAGSEIVLIDGDRDTVENFSAGFGNHDDRIILDTDLTPEFKFDGENLSVTSGGNLRGILADVANNSDFVEFLTADDDGDDVKVAVAQKGKFIVVGDELADLYYGENSGVDFTAYSKILMLDMDGDGSDGILFYGINSVIAGSGLTTLVGTDGDDTLVAGSGGTRMWSNWGNDLMIGNTDADKNKETEFFYLAGDGHDTIRSFEFFTPDNATTADKLNFLDNAVTDAVVTNDGDVYLKLEDDDDWLDIEGAQGKKMRVNDFIAKVDKDIVTYEDDVDFYVATGEGAVLQVNESAEVWLDDDEDKVYAGDFRIIDATKSTGANTLAGNTDDNTIFGGAGDNSLWGGDGAEGDDVLYGGDGQNAFFYTTDNGSDTIRAANDGDDVVLHGITLEQIASTDITADAVEINFTDGGSVRVEGTADVTYHLGDGSKFSADHSQGEWNSK